MMPKKAMTREESIANHKRLEAEHLARYQARQGGGGEALGGKTEGAAATTTTVSQKAISHGLAKKTAGASESLSIAMGEMSRADVTPAGIFVHDAMLNAMMAEVVEQGNAGAINKAITDEKMLKMGEKSFVAATQGDIQWEDPEDQAAGFFKSVMGEGGLIGGLGEGMSGMFGGFKESLGGMFSGLKESLFKKEEAESTPEEEAMGALAEKGMDPGSIYTHDIHVEKMLKEMNGGITPLKGVIDDTPPMPKELITLSDSLKKTGGPQAFYNQTYDEKMWKTVNPDIKPLSEPGMNPMAPKIAEGLKQAKLSITGQAEKVAFARPTLSKKGAAAGIGDLTPTNLSEVIEREHGAGAEGKHVPPANQAGDAGVASMQKKIQALSGRGGIGGVNLAFADQAVAAHEVTAVEPHHPVDVHDQMQREYATSEPGDAKFTSPDLAKVANTNDAQVHLQTQMLDVLGVVAKYLEPGNPSGGSPEAEAGDTATNYVTHRPPTWGKWTTGKHNQTPNKGVLNVGQCTL